MALFSEALLPNLAQTTEGTPAMVHCGPFANIAHGTSSVISQEMGMRMADYVVNETGFASDLGFEKYMDLVSPLSGIKPSVAVLVTTVQSVKEQGEGDLERGFANLEKHIAIVRGFDLPVVVAINRFPTIPRQSWRRCASSAKHAERFCALGGVCEGRRRRGDVGAEGRGGDRGEPGTPGRQPLRMGIPRSRRSPRSRRRSTARTVSS